MKWLIRFWHSSSRIRRSSIRKTETNLEAGKHALSTGRIPKIESNQMARRIRGRAMGTSPINPSTSLADLRGAQASDQMLTQINHPINLEKVVQSATNPSSIALLTK